jgi:hypothetical protein
MVGLSEGSIPSAPQTFKFNSMSNDTQSTSYWDNTGKYQTEYNKAWKQLIPVSGEAEDGWPEALRAISRVGYDYYNNGFCNLWRSWDDGDTVMDSYYEDMVEYVKRYVPYIMGKELNEFLLDAKGYGNWSDKAGIIDRIIDHIMVQILQENLIDIKEA